MNDVIYIVVTKQGYERTVKTENFTLKPGERAFKLALDVPDAAFATPKVPTVRVAIPVESLIQEIDVNVDPQ